MDQLAAIRRERAVSALLPLFFVSGATALVYVVAKRKDTDAAAFCVGDRCSDPQAITLTEEANDLASAANVTFASGIVLVAAGVVLWIVAPASSPAPVAGGRRLGFAW